MAEALREKEEPLAVRIDNLRSSAREAFVSGNFTDAKRILSEMIRMSPRDAEALFNRGVVNEQMMLDSAAMADYNGAIGADPLFYKSYVNRGRIYAKLGKHKEALQDFNQATRIEPNCPEAYLNMGTVYLEMDKYREAIAMFDECIRQEPDNADAYYRRSLAKSGAGDNVGAARDMEARGELLKARR